MVQVDYRIGLFAHFHDLTDFHQIDPAVQNGMMQSVRDEILGDDPESVRELIDGTDFNGQASTVEAPGDTLFLEMDTIEQLVEAALEAYNDHADTTLELTMQDPDPVCVRCYWEQGVLRVEKNYSLDVDPPLTATTPYPCTLRASFTWSVAAANADP